MTRKSNANQNYGIYAVDRFGTITRQVFDGTDPARYETIEQANAALPRLQAIETAYMNWGLSAAKLIVAGRTW